ncbi:MAG TPA: Rpn family recombination-promoting nuclease/putative transposase [Polyangiaceae bacterium]
MSIDLLDPTSDIVFKLLLIRNQHLLRDMIEAVLAPRVLAGDLLVTNPEIPKEFPVDKSIFLDIRAQFRDGEEVDLEMQSITLPGARARFLYYWAKTYSEGIACGDDYTVLHPCISILWFKEPTLEGARFHSVFRLSDERDREVFCPNIEFHVLELPKLHLAPSGKQAKLEQWARFLRARSVVELEELAREDAVMNVAKDALCTLSSDAEARRLARERERTTVAHRHTMGACRAEGKAEGEAQGRAAALRVALGTLCRVLGIELDEARSIQVSNYDTDQLAALMNHIELERRWPDQSAP